MKLLHVDDGGISYKCELGLLSTGNMLYTGRKYLLKMNIGIIPTEGSNAISIGDYYGIVTTDESGSTFVTIDFASHSTPKIYSGTITLKINTATARTNLMATALDYSFSDVYAMELKNIEFTFMAA